MSGNDGMKSMNAGKTKIPGGYRLKAIGISVDSGMIIAIDPSVVGGNVSDVDANLFNISNGRYDVYWKILNSPLDKNYGKGTLVVKTGRVLVIDPCYLYGIDQAYDDLYDYKFAVSEGRSFPVKGSVSLHATGGDGSFDVLLELKKK